MRLIIGDIYQGREKYALAIYGEDISIYRQVLEDVRAGLENGYSEDDITSSIIKKAMEFDVVIAEEGFSGLTPIEKDQRIFTEVYGRTLCALAERAETVERVVCGLAIGLK